VVTRLGIRRANVHGTWVTVIADGQLRTEPINTAYLLARRLSWVVGLTLDVVHACVTALWNIQAGATALLVLANIGGAWVSVIAFDEEFDADLRYGTTSPLEACCISAAIESWVIARLTAVIDLQVHAADIRIALVECAGIAVITEVVLGVACAILTDQFAGVEGTYVTIVTVCRLVASLIAGGDCEILTSLALFTEVVGAWLSIGALTWRERALSGLRVACIVGAWVIVVACRLVYTSIGSFKSRVASVVGADITVVAWLSI
jgi:hypothetical protein